MKKRSLTSLRYFKVLFTAVVVGLLEGLVVAVDNRVVELLELAELNVDVLRTVVVVETVEESVVDGVVAVETGEVVVLFVMKVVFKVIGEELVDAGDVTELGVSDVVDVVERAVVVVFGNVLIVVVRSVVISVVVVVGGILDIISKSRFHSIR
ncbi:unnamed protein product [Nippostrongylus brasiliensis]|uniref:Uncharacterized protein n=1 Tax=Nippostrongylus brasiliensis TaxID=27835 RepID=A0A0N4Y207_NIPBR|nr:unnamed protein product [Nippostrongylus brasiliensis]